MITLDLMKSSQLAQILSTPLQFGHKLGLPPFTFNEIVLYSKEVLLLFVSVNKHGSSHLINTTGSTSIKYMTSNWATYSKNIHTQN